MKPKHKFLLLLLFQWYFSIILLGQNHGKGLNFNDEAYGKLPMKAPLMRGDYAVPIRHSLKKYSPIPKNQGEYGTCVGWSSAYVARTIAESIRDNRSDRQEITRRAFSAGFLYQQIKSSWDGNCSEGSYIEDALKFMKNRGVVRYSDFSQDCPHSIPQYISSKAQQHRIKGFATLFGIYDGYAQKTERMKKALSENKPVIIGMNCPPSFSDASGVWHPTESPLVNYGGHAMCVIGYDDTKYGGAFEIQNSWGTNWGNQGYIWVKYTDFHRFVKYGYELFTVPKIELQKPDLSGKITLPLASGGQMIPIHQGNGYYKVTKGMISGTKFRIRISNNEPAFVYAFGSDLSKKSYRIFPHKSGISPALTYKSNNIAIPDEQHFIRIDDNQGTDFLCVLYSKEELDINLIMNQMEIESGNFQQRLQKVIGNKLVLTQNTTYQSGSIEFSAISSGKSVVAVITEIKHL